MSLSLIERLDAVLREVAERTPQSEARVQGVGTYPNPEEVLALWAGVTATSLDLQGLSTAILDAVKGFGWALDRRTFRPQLLLGRSRTPVDARRFIQGMDSYTGPAWTFDALAVLQARATDGSTVDLDIFNIHSLATDH